MTKICKFFTIKTNFFLKKKVELINQALKIVQALNSFLMILLRMKIPRNFCGNIFASIKHRRI